MSLSLPSHWHADFPDHVLWVHTCSRPVMSRRHCFSPVLPNPYMMSLSFEGTGVWCTHRHPTCGWAFHWHLFNAHWPFVSFRVNKHALHKESSLSRSERFTDLRVERYEFRGQFDFIWQNKDSGFTPGAYELPNNGFLTRFAVADMHFLLWEMVSYPHDKYATIAPMGVCCHVVINVAHRRHSWVTLLIISPSCSLHSIF